MNEYYDALETRDPEARERESMAALPSQIAHAKASAPYFAALLSGVEPDSINSRKALAQLAVTRKSDLTTLQQINPPFAGMTAVANGRLARVFFSPGPICDPEGHASDYWGTARALFAAGFRAGDIIHNSFSYHLTPAGSMFDTGAHALGCAVVPAGVGQTEMQLAAIATIQPTGYAGTPSFLKLLIEKSDELKMDVSSIRRAIVGGEAFLSLHRQLFVARGIDAVQAYASADLGVIAFESAAREGLIANENLIIEIVRPGTGDPLPEGEVGEVVVTTFNRDYPLLRFATGDLSAVLPGVSPCGRTNMRIKGWMGRADQTTKVRGMFVHPGQVSEIVRRHPEIIKARLVISHVDSNDSMCLRCESTANLDESRIMETIREVTKLRGEVERIAPQTLPNDGKVIEDARRFD
jgi:phenylacetate-CoA ligase